MEAVAAFAAIAVAGAVVFASFAVRQRVAGGWSQAEERLFAYSGAPRASEALPNVPLRRRASSLPFISALLMRRDRGERTAQMLERAGLGLRPGEFALIRLTLGLVAFVIVLSLASGSGIGAIIGIPFAAGAYLLPRFFVAWRASRRISQMEAQFIEMLDLVASSLRSGFSLLQALDSAYKRLGAPLSDELDRVLTDVRFGRQMEDALNDWSSRVGSADLQLIVTAIGVQRHSGGNLSEVLENLAQTMRERTEVRQQVQSLTSYARLTACIVAAYPPAIAVLLTVINSKTWGILWTEPIGWAMLGTAGALNLLAFIMLRAIARVDY